MGIENKDKDTVDEILKGVNYGDKIGQSLK